MKAATAPLLLHESTLLLALRDREGTIAAGSMYEIAIGGALVSELLLGGRIAIDSEKKKDFVRLVSSRKVGEPLLDEALVLIGAASRRKTVQAWVQKLAELPKLKHRIAGRLCDAGVLRAAEDRVLGIFSRKVYPEADHGPEADLADRMRKAVLSESKGLDPRLVVLISLAHHTGLLRAVLDKKEIKARKERLKEIENAAIVDKAVKGAVDAVQTALFVATIMPAVYASSIH